MQHFSQFAQLKRSKLTPLSARLCWSPCFRMLSLFDFSSSQTRQAFFPFAESVLVQPTKSLCSSTGQTFFLLGRRLSFWAGPLWLSLQPLRPFPLPIAKMKFVNLLYWILNLHMGSVQPCQQYSHPEFTIMGLYTLHDVSLIT